MFPYHLLPKTRGHETKRTYEEKAERANFYADRRIAYKIARGEASGNTEYWKKKFPEVFVNVEVEKANKTMDSMLKTTKEIKKKLQN